MTNLKTLPKAELGQFLKKDSLTSRQIPTAIENLSIIPDMEVDMLKVTPPVAINRDFYRRVAKQTPNFLKDLKGQKVFTVFNVTEHLDFSFHGEKIEVTPGWYIADGNTRLEAHRQGKIKLPEQVLAQIITVKDSETYMQEYFAIDNAAATENSSDLVRSAIGFLGLNLDSTVAKGGNFASALKNAYPLDKKHSVLEKVAFFKKELEILDECNIFNPSEGTFKHQHFYGAMLIAAKLYGTPPQSALKLKTVLKQLSTIDAMDLNKGGAKWNGITALVYQCSEPAGKEWIPVECQGKTNFASIEPSYDFYLYCMEMCMTDKMLNKHRGFKPSNWEGYYQNSLDLIAK